MEQEKRDIKDRDDIQLLIDTFYSKVRTDELIGTFFTDVVSINWETHMPKMYDFWEGILFGVGKYRGNPITAHIDLDKKKALNPAHFTRWKKLFFETIDALFKGQRATLIKDRVTTMEQLMLYKIKMSRENGFIQ